MRTRDKRGRFVPCLNCPNLRLPGHQSPPSCGGGHLDPLDKSKAATQQCLAALMFASKPLGTLERNRGWLLQAFFGARSKHGENKNGGSACFLDRARYLTDTCIISNLSLWPIEYKSNTPAFKDTNSSLLHAKHCSFQVFYVDLILTTFYTGGAGALDTSRRSYTQLSGGTGIRASNTRSKT